MHTVTVDRNSTAPIEWCSVVVINVCIDNGKGCEGAYPKV